MATFQNVLLRVILLPRFLSLHYFKSHLRRNVFLRALLCSFCIVLSGLAVHAQIPTTGLVAHYPFSGSPNDASGNGHNGTAFGATLTTDRFGNSRSAYLFDGINDYISVTHHNNLNFTTDFTISAWIRTCYPNTSQWDPGILGKSHDLSNNPPNYAGYGLIGRDNPSFQITFAGDPWRYYSTPQLSHGTAINDGIWHHVLYVADVTNGMQYLYLDNGAAISSTIANTGDRSTNTSNLWIGRNPLPGLADSGYFSGDIDDIRLYNRALTAADVGNLYREGGWPTALDTSFTFTLEVLGPTTICRGDSVPLRITSTADRFVWNRVDGLSDPTATSLTATPTTTTTYKVTGIKYTAPAPCADSVKKEIEITITVPDPPRADPGIAQFVCAGDTVTLGGVTSGGTSPYRWEWSPSDDLDNSTVERPRLVVTQTRRYKVVVTDANDCRDSAEVTITKLDPPDIDLGLDTVYCKGGDGILIGVEPAGGNPPFQFSWSPAEGLDRTDSSYVVATPDTTTPYILEVSDQGSCRAYDTIIVRVADPPIADAGPDRTICLDSNTTIGSNAVSGLIYTWSPSDGLSSTSTAMPIASPKETKTYQLTVTDPQSGCVATDEVTVSVEWVDITTSSSQLDFGSLDGCTPDSVLTITLNNTGNTDAQLDEKSFTTTDFSIASPGGTILVPAGGSVEVRIRYAPTTPGIINDQLILRGNPCNVEVVIDLRGNKLETFVAAELSAINFAKQLLCQLSVKDTTFTVSNNGTSSAQLLAPLISPPFTVVSPSFPATITPGNAVQISLRYAPTGIGVFADELRFPFNSGECSDTIRIALSGEVEEPLLVTDEATIDFGSLDGCTTEKDSIIRLRNPSSYDITITATSGISSFQFIDALPLTIPAGEEREITLRYQPSVSGASSEQLTIGYQPCDGELTLNLSGRKQGVSFTIPDSINFGNLVSCSELTKTLPLEILLNSDGGGSGSVTSIAISGPFSTSLTENALLPDGDLQTFDVTFSPTSNGLVTGRLDLTLQPCNIRKSIHLTGTFSSADLTVVTTPVDFGSQPIGNTTNQDVIFTNSGTAPLRIDRLEGLVTPFTVMGTTPTLPATLQPGERLIVTVTYRGTNGSQQSPLRAIVNLPCNLTAQAEVVGSGVSAATALVSLPNLASHAGGNVLLSLFLEESTGLDAVNAMHFRAQIAFEKSLLVVTNNTPWTTNNQERIITVEGTRSGNESVLAEIELQATLGRIEGTPLRLEEFQWLDSTGDTLEVLTQTIDGTFELNNLCRQGGVRLYDPEGEVAIKPVRPNPTSGRTDIIYTTVEPGWTRLSVKDVMGREVHSLFEGLLVPGEYVVDYNAQFLASGTYFLVLETPTLIVSEQMNVIR